MKTKSIIIAVVSASLLIINTSCRAEPFHQGEPLSINEFIRLIRREKGLSDDEVAKVIRERILWDAISSSISAGTLERNYTSAYGYLKVARKIDSGLFDMCMRSYSESWIKRESYGRLATVLFYLQSENINISLLNEGQIVGILGSKSFAELEVIDDGVRALPFIYEVKRVGKLVDKAKILKLLEIKKKRWSSIDDDPHRIRDALSEAIKSVKGEVLDDQH